MESGVNPSALQTEMQRALDVRPRAAGRLAIEAAWRTPETECLVRLLPEATCSPEQQARIQSYAPAAIGVPTSAKAPPCSSMPPLGAC